MADGKVEIDVDLNSRNASSQAGKLGSTINRGVSKGCKAATATVAAVGTASVAAMGLAVKVGASFESQMSTVAAISGATGNDLERLSDKAKEMGEKTAFSATEAGEAFEYMAMAGWKTDEMLNGIEGIMDLAAASGEDLASTSDIVTDALTAFGLKAKDSGHFADVLAQASSNANTNVSMMGETFKYVAPVAGAMGYSAEDTAKAIGLMANSGIKASQAGTSLRSIISRMADPTEKVEGAMKKLGIRLTDSKGNMRSLDDVMKDLRSSFAKLTPEQQAQYASTIAGKNAMSGMLAIVNASEKDYNKLSDAIANADGASKRMAETRLDNLQGDVTILKSKLEALGITMYESVDTPLRDIVQGAQEMIGALNTAMSGGGFDALANTIGDQLGKVASKAVEMLPKLVDISITIIQKFGSSLVKSAAATLPKFISSMGEILTKLITKIFGGTAGNAIKNLFGEFSKQLPVIVKQVSVGLEKLRKFFLNVMNTIVKIASAALPSLVSAFSFLMNNLEKVIPLVLALLTGMKAYAIVSSIVATIKGFSAAVIASKGALNLATIAQYALNTAMEANPIALVATALVALTTAAVAYNFAAGNVTTETQKIMDKTAELSDKLEESKEEWDNLMESYNQLSESSDKRVSEIGLEMEKTESLWTELQKITDENGNIKKGYEDRAAYITGELSSALGIEVGIVNGQIKDYKELQSNMEKVIATKRLELTLDAKTSEYNEAKEKEVELSNKLAEKSKLEEKSKQNLANATDNVKKAQEEYDNKLKESRFDDISMESQSYQAVLMSLQGKLESAKKAQQEADNQHEKTKDELKKASSEYAKIETTISNYDTALKTVGKSTKKMNKACEDLATGFQRHGKVSDEALKRQADSAKKHYEDMKKAVERGNTEISQKQVEEAKKQADKALKEYKKCGLYTVQGYMDGIDENKDKLIGSVATMVDAALEAGKKAAKIHSPSKITMQHGKFLADGYAEGFIKNDPARRITQAFKHSMRSINDAMSNQVISNQMIHTMKMDSMDSIGDAMVRSLQRAGLTVSIDGRQFGRIIKDVT